MHIVKLKLFLLLTLILTRKYQMSEKRFKYILLAILFTVFFIVISRPVEIWNDSAGYLNMAIYRSAGYPIFLWVLKSISLSHMDILTIVSQICIGLSVIYFFIIRLRKLLILHPVLFIFLAMIMVTPYIYNHRLANNYLSEALTYSLYLLVTIFFLEALILNKLKSLWISIPILIVLLMFRSQFLFMVPVALLIILWLIFKQKEKKKYLYLGVAFLILPFFSSLIDKTFHYAVHGHFVSTPWTGIPLSTPAYYVADEQDYSLYESEIEQEFFRFIYSKLADRNLNIHHLKEDPNNDETSFYILNFSEISNHTIYEDGKEIIGQDLSSEEKYIALDAMTKNMVFPLVLDNLGLWLKVYVKNIVYAFGNSKYLLLYVIMLVYGVYGIIKKQDDIFKIIGLLMILTIGNIALVALGMHTIKRFTFYNDWTIFLVFFILMDAFVNPRKLVS